MEPKKSILHKAFAGELELKTEQAEKPRWGEMVIENKINTTQPRWGEMTRETYSILSISSSVKPVNSEIRLISMPFAFI